jgi:hypothetical protein
MSTDGGQRLVPVLAAARLSASPAHTANPEPVELLRLKRTLPEIAWLPKLAVRCRDLDGQPGRLPARSGPKDPCCSVPAASGGTETSSVELGGERRGRRVAEGSVQPRRRTGASASDAPVGP